MKTCPKCGASLWESTETVELFECGTDRDVSTGAICSAEGCLRRQLAQRTEQRDALEKRVRELEEVGDDMLAIINVACHQEQIDAVEARWTKAKGHQ